MRGVVVVVTVTVAQSHLWWCGLSRGHLWSEPPPSSVLLSFQFSLCVRDSTAELCSTLKKQLTTARGETPGQTNKKESEQELVTETPLMGSETEDLVRLS